MEGVRASAQALSHMGVQTEIACCDSPGSSWLDQVPFRTYALGPGAGRYGYAPRLLEWLRENGGRYDAVIVHGIWQYHSFAAWQALHKGKTPYFVFTHGMLDPWFKRTYPLKHLKKWAYWPWADYRVIRDARAVLFTCEEERVLARQSFWLYKANEVVTSYGISAPPTVSAEVLDAVHPGLSGRRIVLFLSRIHEKKGLDLLVEAFARVVTDDKVHLVIAGPDPSGMRASLESRAEALGIGGSVTWLDMVEGETKWALFQAAEVFCLPSHQENFGIVVAEALACRKPVLVSNKVNIWREIESDGAGFVDEDTVNGTEKNLRRWLALTGPEYDAMSDRAQHCFETRFEIEQGLKRLVEVLGGNAS